MRVQQGLAALGFDADPADAMFGPRTRSAIWQSQQAKGLETTGYVLHDEAEVSRPPGQNPGRNRRRGKRRSRTDRKITFSTRGGSLEVRFRQLPRIGGDRTIGYCRRMGS